MKHRRAKPRIPFTGLLLLLLGVGVSTSGYGLPNDEEWMHALQQAIGQTEKYDIEKLNRIDRLQGQLAGSPKKRCTTCTWPSTRIRLLQVRLGPCLRQKLEGAALQSADTGRAAYARVKISFVLLSSGMFKEAFDFLNKIDFRQLQGPQKAEYYTLMARCYYDLADYNQDVYYSPQYNARAKSYMDSALASFPDGSFECRYYAGLQNIRALNLDRAAGYLQSLLRDPHLTPLQTAITASTLSDIYIRRAQVDTAIALLAQAAIADIESATKETSAIFYLATLLFDQGKMEKASAFIHKRPAMRTSTGHGSGKCSSAPSCRSLKASGANRFRTKRTSSSITPLASPCRACC
jgi:tetratricopeptide (TPR) repeat protein